MIDKKTDNYERIVKLMVAHVSAITYTCTNRTEMDFEKPGELVKEILTVIRSGDDEGWNMLKSKFEEDARQKEGANDELTD